MIAYFDRFGIKMTQDQARSASHQGDCYQDAKDLAAEPAIKRQLDRIPPEKIAEELKEFGAWEPEQLQDPEENRIRIIWIAAGTITEEARQCRQ